MAVSVPAMRRLILVLILTLSLLVSPSLCACTNLTECWLNFWYPVHLNLLSSTASATSFCKCTCKGNSTIIALNPKTSSTTSSTSPNIFLRDGFRERGGNIQVREDEETRKTHRASTCNDCNRKFCLDYNLPGCKGVKEEEVFTTCFRMQPSSLSILNTGHSSCY
jgi:hypothetical protein